MYTENWFKLHRKIFDNEIWSDLKLFRFFVYLIGQAVFAEDGVDKGNIHIERGQLLKSYRKIQDELEYIENNSVKQYSLSVIKRMIKNLKEKEMIETKTTKLGTLFTIKNYAKYQDKEQEKEQKIKELRTELEQQKNSRRTAEEQQKNNNKNVKNVKESKEGIKKLNNIVPKTEIKKIYNSIPDYWTSLFEDYIDIYRNKNKTNKITTNKHYKLLSEIYFIFRSLKFEFNKEKFELTEDIFEHGLNQIIKKNIDNLNYAKKVWISEIERRNKNGSKQVSENNQTEKRGEPKEAKSIFNS
ncbi:MAG: hypothetical protein ACOCQA_02505 [bacterium]